MQGGITERRRIITRNDFELKPIDPSTDDYKQGLRIYDRSFDDNLRTDNKIIDYLVNNPTDEREMLPYGLYDSDGLIGFCLFTFYKKERFMCGEYICISNEKRKNNAGRVFLTVMGEEIKRLTDKFAFLEVKQGTHLERLYKSLGAGTLDCIHIIPALDMGLARTPAKLMVFPRPSPIDKETYMRYLHALLFNGYADWVTPFLNEKEKPVYMQYISDTYEEIKRSLPDVIKVLP